MLFKAWDLLREDSHQSKPLFKISAVYSDGRIKNANVVEWLKYLRSKSGVIKQDAASLDKALNECNNRCKRRKYLEKHLANVPKQQKELITRLENGTGHILMSCINVCRPF